MLFRSSSIMALRALPRCWVHLAGVSGGKKKYLVSSILIKIYPTLFTAIGGWDGMDASGAQWMTCAINSTRHPSVLAFVVRGVGNMILYEITYLESITLINVYPTLFTAIGGRDGWMRAGHIG